MEGELNSGLYNNAEMRALTSLNNKNGWEK
jgi:hypothetical protein